ncbi:single-stranded-DNA-specific exonuclease RecJ [Tepidiphilus baoligensis]|uniref:Single-stranded-DNA-specific exonuclease RecJ n=1 Tax=Tepidiphilus baoligensis TaxID=2698687 RepID=A0ABX1QMB3_9PROT|nr:single-stranded-DNA-specific exonuclease RecJ [Tepidiphilus baoligensis]NMH16556.1 single-stranded-DNA-specific exonuclease RecJ [Tepidiphilus baoligensis]
MTPRPTVRPTPRRALERLLEAGIDPLLARLYAARGIEHPAETDTALTRLLPPEAMKGTREAAELLADAIEAQARIVVVGDYDCDGATATAVAVRALRALGARADFLVPNRFTYGYGLSPEIVALAAERFAPDVLITVDNGIASVEGAAAARALGMSLVITDHHLPGDVLPEADAIVDPNQPGCDFPSKAIAGVGVIFYVMLALRAELRQRGAFAARPEPNLAQLLDLVALGTVADVVRLDHNNRILVTQGLSRIRAGRMQPGMRALFQVARRDPARATAQDLGFFLGPRLNAAGRLEDMSLGIACLLEDDPSRALELAQRLEDINRERRGIEAQMREQAELALDALALEGRATLTLFHPEWHQGVIGIVAGRIKERYHRPVFAFAPGDEDLLKGSGRSVPGLHLRDALDWISKKHPGLLLRFGGHAMAAGVTLRAADLARFEQAFEEAAHTIGTEALGVAELPTDGSLPLEALTLATVGRLEGEVWGQGFPPPVFLDAFTVTEQRLLKDAHLQLKLRRARQSCEAIFFGHAEPLPSEVELAYRPIRDAWNGVERLRLQIELARPAGVEAGSV